MAKVRNILAGNRARLLDGISGTLLLLGGVVLATARRP